MLFRKIEFVIDGSAAEQLRRHRGRWTRDRIWRTALKQGVFFALSFVIANVFLAYIIGAEALGRIVTDPPGRHLAGLTAILLFSFVFYAVFARFREQACVLACPYGRMMSSLIDRHTITVTYDFARGEPRGRLVKGQEASGRRGDCIDCHQCVTVCPTAIDIRNGVQLECVNCTACMDACDGVMRRIGRRSGLIRLTSFEAVSAGRGRWLTPRVLAYAAIWTVLVGSVTLLVAARPALDVVVLRQPGTLYASLPDGRIANFYDVQVFNRSAARLPFELVAVEPPAAATTPIGLLNRVDAHELAAGRLLVTLPAPSTTTTPVRFELRVAGQRVRHVASSFVGPPGRPTGDEQGHREGGEPSQ
jgi:cytochrome c oxidase accessory protein FixG